MRRNDRQNDSYGESCEERILFTIHNPYNCPTPAPKPSGTIKLRPIVVSQPTIEIGKSRRRDDFDDDFDD